MASQSTYTGPYEGTYTLTYTNVTGQVGAGETPDKILDGNQETKFFQWRPLPEPIEFWWSLDYPVTLLSFTIVDANDTGDYPDRVTLTTSFKLQGKVNGVWTDAYSSNSWPGLATNYGRKEIAVQTELTAQDWRILWINTGDAQVADIIFSTIERDITVYPDLDPQPDNTLSKFFGPLLLRRRFGGFGSTVRYERIAYIYLNTGTYYELDQLGTHYESWTVDCVFQNRGVATGNGQNCWNWSIDVPTKRRLGCTFFSRYQTYTGDCNCGWADGYGHGNDDGWLGGFTGNGTMQVYRSGAGWGGNLWYRGVSLGASNSWTRYNNYVPSIENPYSGSYNGTNTQARTFGSYSYSDAENATAMTPFCLGDINLYPGNTISSFQYPPRQMYVNFAAWKLTIDNQVIAEYLPVLVGGSIPCILNTVNRNLYYPHGVTPTYSMTF